MTELKRSVGPVDQESRTSSSKCQKVDLSMSSKDEKIKNELEIMAYREGNCEIYASHFPKERKEKLGEKITALQQLVSPYGKTDTASVLSEAMDYIRFLHEQVKVLSAPYLYDTPVTNMEVPGHYSLRSKGLCLVPISYTDGLARNNGADIWAPIKTPPPKF